MNQPISNEAAHLIYDILERTCEAPERERSSFVRYATDPHPMGVEFRFGGLLGSGGKFYGDDRWHVEYYTEDKSQFRDHVRDGTNEELTELLRSRNTAGEELDARLVGFQMSKDRKSVELSFVVPWPVVAKLGQRAVIRIPQPAEEVAS